MKRIVCIGDNCIDYYDATGEAYPGGNPVNVAVYTCRLGGSAAYIGAVGNDENGALMLLSLKSRGVDVSRVKVMEGATALTHVALQNGDRILGEYEEGVMARFALDGPDFDFIAGHELAVSGLWGMVEGDLARIRALGVTTAFDCADRPDDPAALTALPHTDIAFFSDDESDEGALMRRMGDIASQGPTVVVATRGSRGSMALCNGVFTSFGILDCKVVDTMGAGDSFIAGFLNEYLAGGGMEECMAAGARQSAITLGYFGAW